MYVREQKPAHQVLDDHVHVLFLVDHAYENKCNDFSDNIVYITKNSIEEDNKKEEVTHTRVLEQINVPPKSLDQKSNIAHDS